MRIEPVLVVAALAGCGGPVAPQGAGDFLIPAGDVTIAGTLDLPSGPGPHPVLVFVTGSGTDTRAADRPVVDIALPQGLAVFRYDKRGLGQSTGTFEEASVANSERVLDLRARDVVAIVDFLATHQDIRADQIFLWGASQGGWVAPLAASLSDRIAFVMCASGGGSPIGTSDHYDALADNPALTIEELTDSLSAFTGPFGYDPRPVLASLDVPVLWVYGGRDRSNPSLYDIAQLEQIVDEHGADFTILLFADMNHDLIDETTGTFPTDLFASVFGWANPRLGR